jgi:hypothetical protein
MLVRKVIQETKEPKVFKEQSVQLERMEQTVPKEMLVRKEYKVFKEQQVQMEQVEPSEQQAQME